MTSLSILLLGDADRAEFRDARPSLDRWGTVHSSPDLAAATALLSGGELVPDVIVIAQAFPDQFSHATIERVRRLAPLAPVVGLLGSWCEGEMRSGRPWPAAVRTYWHQWSARCNRQLQRLAHGQCGAWTLPSTATEEERLLAECSRHTPCAVSEVPDAARTTTGGRHTECACYRKHRGLVLIHSQSREMAQWLSATCRSRGFATVWQQTAATSRVEGAAAAIFDAAQLSPDDNGDLRRLAEALRPAPVIALLAYPRIEDHRRVLAAGAAAVLSKPLAVEDLVWELERVESERLTAS